MGISIYDGIDYTPCEIHDVIIYNDSGTQELKSKTLLEIETADWWRQLRPSMAFQRGGLSSELTKNLGQWLRPSWQSYVWHSARTDRHSPFPELKLLLPKSLCHVTDADLHQGSWQ
jgi:hypothetical protein